MQQYNQYKQTDLDWIGSIPSHWEIKKGRNTIQFISGYPFDSSKFENDPSLGFPLIRIRNIVSGKTDTYYSGEIVESALIKKGDILVGMDGDYNCAIWNGEDALLNQRVLKIEGSKLIESKFLYYLIPIYLKVINDLTYFTTVKHLSVDDLKRISLPIPEKDEQLSIIKYLDNKTDQINQIIQQKELLLEKLQAKRQAIINEAVTKGLNPTVPMKPSGVEWLGDIPDPWEVKKLKYLCDLNSHIDLNLNDFRYKVALENIESKTGKFVFSEEDKAFEGDGNVFLKGDVLFSKLRPYLAKVFLPEKDGCAVGELLVLSPKTAITSKFLFYRLISPAFIDLVNSSTYGSKMPRANWNFISNIQIGIPSIDEQEKTIQFLDKKIDQLDRLKTLIVTQIQKLNSYRQSLISEVVTGKIKVL